MEMKIHLIPKNKPKQETLEDASKNYANYNEQIKKAVQEAVKFGANWKAEKMYSEHDMQEYATFCIRCYEQGLPCIIAQDWFKLYKN